MPKPIHKHKLLLDEQMCHRNRLSQLNNLFDVRHVAEDLRKAGISDGEVYKLAVKQRRIIVTRNIKHFRPLAGLLKDAGVIGVSGDYWDKIDKQLAAFLKKTTPKSLAGKYVSL